MSQIWTGYNDVTNVTGISYENAKNRVLCVSLLTTAKLTRSCADQYTGAINYTQFTTDIAWEVNERCKRLALEHHKCDKMRTPKACDAGCHAKTSVTPRRGSPCGCPRGLHLSPRSAQGKSSSCAPSARVPRCYPCARPMGPNFPTKYSISVSASGENGTNGTPGRYQRMRFSYDRCPIRTRNSYDSDHTLAQRDKSGTRKS